MESNRKASRYMGFDAIKGLGEAMASADEFTNRAKYPHLSEEQRNQMDVILYLAYSNKKVVAVSYYKKGFIYKEVGVIERIDYVERRIILEGKIKINLAQIVALEQV